VVTDSAANLPAEVIDRHSIDVVPMILKFGERELQDGIDLDGQTFYRELAAGEVAVSTSAPSVGNFREAFDAALGRADAVVCLTVASFVSATYEAAVAAAKDLGDRVRVIDSRSASLGEGLPAVEAARTAGEGADADAVAARAADIVGRTSFVATINTFEFLRRSGRVNSVLAYAATTLDIKPVFAFRKGALEQLGRPRTRRRAIERVLQEVRAGAAPACIGVAHAACGDEASELLDRLRAEFPHADTLLSEFTPLMGAHTGPGVLGVAFWS
jgi:DegV family protein with EDD domain